MFIRLSVAGLITLTLFSTGCGAEIRIEATPTQNSLTVTETLSAPLTQLPSETPLPPLPQPTITPVEGVTSTQINVRAEPSTSSNVLGIISAGTRVEITGKDPGGNWWQINYSQGVDGKGWVTAQYVTTADTPEVPVIGGDEADPDNGNIAIVQQQLNVRSGPGTDFNSLGTLNAQDVVKLTGKDREGAWLQIDFAAGPEGRGWVNAAFVRATGVENLPIVTEAGLVVGTGTPTVIPFTPTATFLPAIEDDDSAQSPSVSVTFSAAGTRDLQYTSDVSSPAGDPEDWLQFTPYTNKIWLEVSCKGSDVHIEIIQNGQQIGQASCATQKLISVLPGNSVQLNVSALPESTQNYSSYTLRIATP